MPTCKRPSTRPARRLTPEKCRSERCWCTKAKSSRARGTAPSGIATRRRTPKSLFCAKPHGFSAITGLQRSEEHTSELQSRLHLVCRLLLEKKKTKINPPTHTADTMTIYNKLIANDGT